MPSHRPCASAIVRKPDGSLLLVHKPRERDDWQIPQGGVESGESMREAASRELREETGIEIRPENFTELQIHYQYDYPQDCIGQERPTCAGQRLTFVAATVPEETVVTVDGQELDGFAWVMPEELGRYLKRKEYRRVVEKAVGRMGNGVME